MRNTRTLHLAVATALLMALLGSAPVSANVALNGIEIGKDFNSVLDHMARTPDLVGPSLASIEEVNNILNPPPAATASAGMGMPGMPGVSQPPTVFPTTGPPMMGDPGMGAPAAPVELIPKGRSDYVFWAYHQVGKNGYTWTMYIMFDRGLTDSSKAGQVVGVVLWLTSKPQNKDTTHLSTPDAGADIQLGSNMTKLIGAYGYPNPMVKIGANYFLAYPDRQIAYTVNTTTHKVIGIEIGEKLLTLVPRQSAATAAGSTPTGTSGSMPGGANPSLAPLPGQPIQPK